MPKEYFFTVNLLIKTDTHIEETVASVMENEKFFTENIQLILIDSVCSEKSIQICSELSEKYADNVCFVDTSGKKPSASYNDAYPIGSGKYIAFIDNFGMYSKNTLSMVYDILNDDSVKIDILSVMPMAGSKPYIDDIPLGMVSLKEMPDRFILMMGCYFFASEITDKLSFDTRLRFHALDKFVIQALAETYSFLFTNTCSYTTFEPTERNFLTFEPQYSKFFYTSAINEFVMPMLESYSNSMFVKSALMYIINIKFALNQNDRYKYVLNDDGAKDFIGAVSNALQYIDDCIIINQRWCRLCGLDTEFGFCLIKSKYGSSALQPDIDLVLFKDFTDKNYLAANGQFVSRTLNGEFAMSIHQAFLSSSKNITVEIAAVNFRDGILYIDAFLQNVSYISDFSIYALINQNRIPIQLSEIYALQTYFNIPFIKKFPFKFAVPVSSDRKIDNACIMIQFQNLSFRLSLSFSTVFARLSNTLQSSYWCFSDRVMTYDSKLKTLIIRRCTDSLMTFCESKFLGEMGRMTNFGESVRLRQLRKSVRHLLKGKNGKKYLVFYDEFGINSNGNLLFRYFFKSMQDHSFVPFFITEKNSPEYEFLVSSGYENVIEAGSKKAYAIILAADFIFASNCNVYGSLMFTESDRLYLRDLFNAEIISVKNFFLTCNTSPFDNRLNDNIRRCFCASESEKANLLKPEYDFTEDMISITGYPIFDSSFDQKENLILIAPGNRKQFFAYNYSTYSRFNESKFFKIYNAILTDNRLLDTVRQYHFKIAVLMPPSVESFMQSFYTDESISFYPYTEKNMTLLVSKAAVMVTDYSELLYKMAYLDKPVVYYFPKSLPIQSEYKNDSLSESAFGEIFSEHEPLIQYLVENIPQNFPQPEKYHHHTETFFQYRDNTNCRRILESILKDN